MNTQELYHKNILITGANGLIASVLTDRLAHLNMVDNAGIELYALVRNQEKAERRFPDYVGQSWFHIIIQDVCEPLQESLLESKNESHQGSIKPDYIIHAACNAHPLAFSKDPVGTMKANLLGTMQLLEYARVHGIMKFLYISSSEIYGENPIYENGFTEDSWGRIDSMNSRACYPEGKRAAETLCASYADQYSIPINVVRPGYIYGGQITQDNSRADAQFFRRAAAGEDIIMKSTGSQIRSYCYVEDAVSAILTVLTKGIAGEAYNIANRNSNVSVKEFAQTIADCAGVDLKFEIPKDEEARGYSKVTRAVLAPDKLEQLGWSAGYSLKEGVKESLGHMKKDDWLK